MKKTHQRGFSLIEIMVVIVIMGMLVGIVGPAVFDNIAQGQQTKVKADFANIKTALQSYRLDNFIYPSTEQGLQALSQKPDIDPIPRKWGPEGYLEKIPRDPWDQEYIYVSPGDNHPYEIFSYGADGIAGGEGDAADISYWDQDTDDQ